MQANPPLFFVKRQTLHPSLHPAWLSSGSYPSLNIFYQNSIRIQVYSLYTGRLFIDMSYMCLCISDTCRLIWFKWGLRNIRQYIFCTNFTVNRLCKNQSMECILCFLSRIRFNTQYIDLSWSMKIVCNWGAEVKPCIYCFEEWTLLDIVCS